MYNPGTCTHTMAEKQREDDLEKHLLRDVQGIEEGDKDAKALKWLKTYRPANFRVIEPGKMEIAERVDALEEVEIRKVNGSLYQLAIDCLQDEPTARPSTVDLTKTLSKLSIKSQEDLVSILEVWSCLLSAYGQARSVWPNKSP